MGAIRNRLTYANVIATIALFVALGGGAYAATAAKNSVKSKSIAKGAVRTSDIANNAVSRAKLKPNAVRASALADNSVGAKQLGTVVTRQASKPLPDDSNNIVVANCRAGEKMVGIGGFGTSSQGSADITAENPEPTAGNTTTRDGEVPTGALAFFQNLAGGAGNTIAYVDVLCLQ